MTDLTINRGEAKTYQFAATNSGSALDLTGAVIYWAAYAAMPAYSLTSDATAAIEKTSATSGEITVTNAAGGLYELTIVKADTSTLATGTYWHATKAVLAGASDPVVLDNGGIFTISDVPLRAV